MKAQLPSSWCWTNIESLSTVVRGGSPRPAGDPRYFGGPVPWITVGSITSDEQPYLRSTVEGLTEAGKERSRWIAPETLLLTNSGATLGVPKIALIGGCINDGSVALLNVEYPLKLYLYYFLKSQTKRLRTINQGAAQPNLNTGIVKAISVPLAPENEQRRIIAKIEELFSDLDAGVAALKRAKANLKRYRASVLKAAVEGKLTEQWRAKHPAKEPASALLARILKERRLKWEADQLAKFAAVKKEPPKNWRDKYVVPTPPDTTELPELPEGWCWATTGFLCDCIVPNRDKPKSFSGDIPWVTLPDLDGRIQVVASSDGIGLTEAEATLYKAKVIPAGSVIMSCIGRFGLSAVLGRDAVINQQLHAFLVPALLSARYIAYSIRTQERLMISLSTATTIAYLNQDKCNAIPIPLAPLAEQKQIVNEVDFRLSQIAAADRQIELNLLRAARLRQSILKRAFEGKLVPQDPKDEPASALLERLRASRAIHERSGNRPSSAIPHRSKSRGKKS